MAQKILVVDDDKDICEILAFNLRYEHFDVDCAYSAEEALTTLTPEHSLILLDVMMEGMSGYKLAEQLRAAGNRVPIIFLTAKNSENDMLTGFSVGADDYITKPFSIKEVIARVKAVLSRLTLRATATPVVPVIEADGLTINVNTKEASINGEKLSLTKKEFEVLTLLAQQPDKMFSRQNIIEQVWSETPYITERTVDVHITRLRKKLGRYAAAITNKSGYGYRFNPANLCD